MRHRWRSLTRLRSCFLPKDVGCAMIRSHTFDEEHVAFGILRPKRQDFLIVRRSIPASGPGQIQEGDHDQIAGEAPFQQMVLASAVPATPA